MNTLEFTFKLFGIELNDDTITKYGNAFNLLSLSPSLYKHVASVSNGSENKKCFEAEAILRSLFYQGDPVFMFSGNECRLYIRYSKSGKHTFLNDNDADILTETLKFSVDGYNKIRDCTLGPQILYTIPVSVMLIPTNGNDPMEAVIGLVPVDILATQDKMEYEVVFNVYNMTLRTI